MKTKNENEELQSRREFFKSAAKKALPVIGAIALALSTLDRIDQHEETATVISIQRLDNAIVRVETEDGNLWEFETDLEDNIDIGDKVIVTFKEFENADRYDDAIVDYEVVE